MKQSFYELLGVTRNADQAQIHAAYARTMERLNAANVHGTAEAVKEVHLIREGYQILSDLVERARYDTKLAASDAGMKLALYPKDSATRRKLGIETIVLSVLSAILGAIIHSKLAPNTDEGFVEYKQAIAKQKGGQKSPITTRAAQLDATDPPLDSDDAKAAEKNEKSSVLEKK